MRQGHLGCHQKERGENLAAVMMGSASNAFSSIAGPGAPGHQSYHPGHCPPSPLDPTPPRLIFPFSIWPLLRASHQSASAICLALQIQPFPRNSYLNRASAGLSCFLQQKLDFPALITPGECGISFLYEPVIRGL